MKKIYSILTLVCLCLFLSCSTDNEEEPFLTGAGDDEEEVDVESYRNKFVVINKVEETMYLIKHVDKNGTPTVVNTDTLTFDKPSRLKGSNENQTAILFRWSKKVYTGHNDFEAVEASFTDGISGYYVDVTLEEEVFQIKIKVKE